MMGRRFCITFLLIVALLSLSFPQGFGRRVKVVRHYGRWHSHQPLHEERIVGRQLVEKVMDYADARANTNPVNGEDFFYPPPSPPAPIPF